MGPSCRFSIVILTIILQLTQACDLSDMEPFEPKSVCELAESADFVVAGWVRDTSLHGEIFLHSWSDALFQVDHAFVNSAHDLNRPAPEGSEIVAALVPELKRGSTAPIGPFGPKELCYNEVRPQERWIVFTKVSLDTRIPEDWYQARQQDWALSGGAADSAARRKSKPRYHPPPDSIRIHADYSNGPYSAARPFTEAVLDELAACRHLQLLF